MNPTVTNELGRIRVQWDTGVTFDFDLVRSERSSEVTAEVTVRAWDETAAIQRHLHQARVTVTGTRSRDELGRKLQATAAGHGMAFDWPGLVEAAAVLALRTFREGEPAILLRDAVQPIGGVQLLDGLVLGRHPTIWFGDGGTGKSYLALGAALAIHSGSAEPLGIVPANRHRVAYLDFELEAWDQRERLRRLVDGDLPDIVYRRCVGSLREQVDPLRRMIREQGIGFVVVDSVGYACGGPPEASDAALPFFEGLRMLGVGALCIAHVNRIGDTDKPFGSGFWHNGARATWYVKKQQETASDQLAVGFYNRKSNLGPLERPLGFQLTFGTDRTSIARTDLAAIPELAESLPLKNRIVQALRGGALTYAELAEELESKADSVAKTVDRHKAMFTKVRGSDGIYRVGLLHVA